MKCNRTNCIFNEEGECQPVDQEDYKNAEPNNYSCPVYFEEE